MPAPIKHTFTTKAITPTVSRKGRKPKPASPPMPKFEISEFEQSWYDYFIATYQNNYPDLTDSDNILLMLAGIEFVKYLRVAGEELASGEVISQARQHPGSQMNALLDRLSTTRKARERKPRDDEDPNAEFLRVFQAG